MDWLILVFPIVGAITLLWARCASKRIRTQQTELEESIRQRNNARVISHARSMAAMLSDEDKRRQLLVRIEQLEKMVAEYQAHLF